jgi:hypothetical protein
MRLRSVLLFAAFCAIATGSSTGQISITSLTEVQRGRVVGEDPSALSNVYEQFNVNYHSGDFQAGGRFEVYRASVDDRSMTFLSQRFASWSSGPARVVAGNFYGILGRGLLMRAYELPGVVLESTLFRQKYTNTQDMEGSMASWTDDRFEFKALAGRPVAGDIPPGYPDTISTVDKLVGIGSDRRKDWILGGEASFRPVDAIKFGVTGINLRPQRSDNSYAWSWLAGLELSPLFERAGMTSFYGDVYVEIGKREQFARDGHGRYVSGNIGIGSLGLSAEYKNYDNFDLLANDPPQLIREHTSYLMNRNTHILQTLNESGYQFEAVYPIPGIATVTGNVSRGKNRLSSRVSTIFDERFISLDLDFLPDAHNGSVFFDWGRDELEAIATQRTGGILAGTSTDSGQSFEAIFELQRGKLPFGASPWYWDTYALLSWQSPRGFGLALAMDRSTSPSETDQAGTLEVETDPVRFFSVNANARFDRYEALLFVGERRGGTACTSGSCYEVLAFKGAEMRLTTRF